MFIPDENPRWYCLSTRPKQENKVALILRKQMGLEVFSPRIRFQRARQSAPVWFMEALFPGYVFARCVYAANHRQIRATPGVAGFVHFGENVAPLGDDLINELRGFAHDTETVQVEPEATPGEEIIIASGPYAGMRALVTRLLPASQRVAILLEILGQQREVVIESDRLLNPNPRRSV